MKILFWKHSNDYDKVYRWLIIAVPVVAAALSLWIGLRQSVWFDEAYSIMVAKRSASEIIRLSALDTHPPLYYLVLKIWANVFGWSELALRSLSVIFYGASIAVAGCFIKKHFNAHLQTRLKYTTLIYNYLQVAIIIVGSLFCYCVYINFLHQNNCIVL